MIVAVVILLMGAVCGGEESKSLNERLWDAASDDDVALSRRFIAAGANVNWVNSDYGGVTPLYMAAQLRRQNISAVLLENGADPNVQAINTGRTPLHMAARLGRQDICTLLLKDGADPNVQANTGQTPLYMAARDGHQDVCALLLQQGADPNVQNNNGVTPLYMAAWHSRQDICAVLLQHGADPNVQDDNGWTALMTAVYNDEHALTALLLQWGTSVTLENNDGNTAWDLTETPYMKRILAEQNCDPWTLHVDGQADAVTTKPEKTIIITCPYGDTNQTYHLSCQPNSTWDRRPLCNKDECVDGTYGLLCDGMCGYCHNATCDKMRGIICPQDCEAGYYDLKCHKECGQCASGHCDRQTGKCPHRCAAGYHGDMCDKVCVDGTYGDRCLLTCGHCNSATCDNVRGECHEGCKAGYYDIKCQNECGHCALDDTCETINGLCPQSCEAGYYDIQCQKECGQCALSESCDLQTGKCPNGCSVFYHGDNCDKDTYKWILITSAILIVCVAVVILVLVRYKHRTNQHQNNDTIEMLPAENFLSRVKDISLDLFENIMQLVIEPERVELGRQVLGEGNFGAVYKGTYNSAEGQKPIAAKTLKGSDPSAGDYCDFIKEATMMREFQHENVLTLYGVMIKENRPYVILPFMENGDLHTYLANPSNRITVGQMIQYALEIARGMNYLASMKFVHRDLAARNCMITENQLVKIADFGLTRDIYEKSYYRIDDFTRPLPRKWLAIETLQLHIFSTKSDVWSYGVTFWEILMRGTEPYPDISSIYIKDYLQAGKRMDQPPCCPYQIYELMRNCWQKNPEDRPDFQDIQKFIEDLFKNIRVDSEHVYMEPVSIVPEGFTGTMGAAMVDSEDAYLEPVSVIPEGFTGTMGVTVVDIHE